MLAPSTSRLSLLGIAIALSIGAHVATYLSIPVGYALPSGETGRDHLEIDVFEPPPAVDPEPEAEPDEEPEPEPEPEPVVAPPEPRPAPRAVRPPPERTRPPRPSPTPTPDDEPPPQGDADEPPPVRFGETMTSENGVGHARSGENQDYEGPAGPGGGNGNRGLGQPDGEPGGTGQGSGPSQARAAGQPTGRIRAAMTRIFRTMPEYTQGIEGSAAVRVRINPDGSVQTLGVIHETHPGFGNACAQAVSSTPWQPALNDAGQPVSTMIPSFPCNFVIRRR